MFYNNIVLINNLKEINVYIQFPVNPFWIYFNIQRNQRLLKIIIQKRRLLNKEMLTL